MDKKFKLGCDVDGVVLDSGPLYHKAFEKLGLVANPEQLHLWYFEKIYGTDKKTVEKVLSKVAAIINVSPTPGSQMLNKIVNLPHIESPIHFVSSRDISSHKATWKALKRHFDFPFQLWCGGSKMNKGIACDLFGIDFFVEDGPPHIMDIVTHSSTELYILNKPYNQDVGFTDATRVLRVNNWSEILVDLAREGYREAVRVSEPPHNL